MLVGLSTEERKQLGLTSAHDYEYLCKVKVLTFSDDEIWNILKLLAGILHVGNIKYKETAINNLDATEITNKNLVDMIANLL